MPELAYLNGQIMPIEAARVSIEDRGYQFGDAVYEYIAGYNGRLFALEPHLDRLENSMRALRFPPLSRDRIRQGILTLHRQANIHRAGVYVQISRGVAPRNHAFPEAPTPQIVMTVRRVPDTPTEYITKGIRAITVTDIRWGRCDIKTVQLLPNTLCKQRALDAGAQEAIFIGTEGVVREGTSSNLFIRIGEQLHTHPRTEAILPGITRAVVMEICRELALPVEERFFNKQEMLSADEVFLTGTVTEVLPVVRIDGQVIGDGRPGSVAARLRTRLEARAAQKERSPADG